MKSWCVSILILTVEKQTSETTTRVVLHTSVLVFSLWEIHCHMNVKKKLKASFHSLSAVSLNQNLFVQSGQQKERNDQIYKSEIKVNCG